jgi:hypothetical protein
MKMHGFLPLVTLLAGVVHVPPSYANDSIALTRPDRGVQMRLLRAYTLREQPLKKQSVPITPGSVLKTVDDRIRVLFDRAADPSTHLVTVTSADKAGLGFFIDHFAEIDSDRDGTLEFGEVKGFLDARSPIARPASKEIKTIEQKGIQIIE